jgi:hypothetical protein
MTKQFKKVDSKGREEIWEWEETPELLAALSIMRNDDVQRRIRQADEKLTKHFIKENERKV